MGQANKVCPVCGRQPGNPHEAGCPRSKGSVGRLRAAADIMSKPRVVYPGKGAVVASFEDVDGTQQVLTNRGVPFVREGPGKDPFQGGLPKGVSPRELREEVAFFHQGMALQQARLDAAEAAERAPGTEGLTEATIDATYERVGLSWAKYRAAVTAAQEQGEAVVVYGAGGQMVAISPEGGVTVFDPETMLAQGGTVDPDGPPNPLAEIDLSEAEARLTAHLAGSSDMVSEDGTVRVDIKTTQAGEDV